MGDMIMECTKYVPNEGVLSSILSSATSGCIRVIVCVLLYLIGIVITIWVRFNISWFGTALLLTSPLVFGHFTKFRSTNRVHET